MLAWLCAATAIAYIDRGCISVAETLIRTDLGLSGRRGWAWLMSAFFITYAIFQIPGSWLDRVWGSRVSLPLFAAAWSLATAVLRVRERHPRMLLVSRLAMGAAEAVDLSGRDRRVKLLVSRRSRRPGVCECDVLGELHGGGRSAIGRGLERAGSWSSAVALDVRDLRRPGSALGDWIRVVVPRLAARPPRRQRGRTGLLIGDPDGTVGDAGVEASGPVLGVAPASRAVMGLAMQQFLRAAGTIFFLTWFPTYLRETRGVGISEAGVLSSLPHWAIVGCFAGGWLSDLVLARTGSLRLGRQGVAVASLAVATACIGMAYPVSNALLAVLVLSGGARSRPRWPVRVPTHSRSTWVAGKPRRSSPS